MSLGDETEDDGIDDGGGLIRRKSKALELFGRYGILFG